MAGGSQKVTVGYRYFLGAHLALCHGPVDVVREILVDDKVAWSVTTGSATAGGVAAGPARIGTLTDVAAVAAVDEETVAEVTFSGRLAKVKNRKKYLLQLATGASHEITLRGISYNAGTDVTTWRVWPATLAFASTNAEVLEQQASASNGGARGGRIVVDKVNLFGGDAREGGIQGEIDIMMGGPGQGANDYLTDRLGRAVPGYRGIVSLVLRQVYMGINPYLKPWAIRLTRILSAEGGAEQWYPSKAQIVTEASISDAAIYFALDASGSMSGTRMATLKAAVATLIEEISRGVDPERPNDMRIVLFSDSVVAVTEAQNMVDANYAALEAWVLARSNTTSGGTDFGVAFESMAAFFNGSTRSRNIVIFVTDGDPSPPESLDEAKEIIANSPAADIFGFNIALTDTSATEQVDNTPLDGVPVVPPGDSTSLVSSLRAAFGNGPDMNPAHIIRECLTNGEWGLGHSELEMGDSFEDCADTLYSEGFGLSFIWQEDGSIEDFILTVLSHIDASLYIDRRTGLWELKLIRADYSVDAVPIFDETNVVDWGRLGRRQPSDLINSITVRFTSAQTEATAAVSVTDTARVQQVGEVVQATRDFPGIRYQNLAVRVAERELRALSAPILSGEIVVNRDGADLNVGDVIRIQSPRRNLDAIMRVTEVGHGDGRSNGISLKLTEDVFGLGAVALSGGKTRPAVSLVQEPKAMTRRMVEEAPYWLLVRELGHDEADDLLTADPTAGGLVALGERPSADASSAQLWADPGTGAAQDVSVAFAPSALLSAAATANPEEVELAVSGWTDIEEVSVGSLAWLGGELVRIDGVDEDSITIGRGCLDTVPLAHAAGTPLVCFDETAILAQTQFAATEEVDVRLLTETGRGVLVFAKAPVDTVTFDQRGLRPLPPGNFRVDGVFAGPWAPLAWDPDGMTFTWAHRDRSTQTSAVIEDHLAASIGPEAGTTYSLRAYALAVDGSLLETLYVATGISGTTSTVDEGDFAEVVPDGAETIRWEVESVRGGLASRVAARLDLAVTIVPPPNQLDFLFEDAGYTAPDGDDINFIFGG